eukprot:m51a1_g4149 hypothetical protein (239) ;mRNA; r:244846-245691
MDSIETVYPTTGHADYGVSAIYDGRNIEVRVMIRQAGTLAVAPARSETQAQARVWLEALRAGNFVVGKGARGLELTIGNLVVFELSTLVPADDVEVLRDRVACLEREVRGLCSSPQVLETHNNSTYTLSNNNQWAQFPGLDALTFTTATPANAMAHYNVATWSEGNTILCTKLMLDGKELTESRAISGDTTYHTNTVTLPLSLAAGQHTLSLHYRTPGNYPNRNFQDWNTVSLRLVLH